jgi:hypothetical protein
MSESAILFILSGIFGLLGLLLLLGGRKEETSYYNALTGREDVREFVSHDPERPELGALKTGGWISLGVGLAMFVFGFIL